MNEQLDPNLLISEEVKLHNSILQLILGVVEIGELGAVAFFLTQGKVEEALSAMGLALFTDSARNNRDIILTFQQDR